MVNQWGANLKLSKSLFGNGPNKIVAKDPQKARAFELGVRFFKSKMERPLNNNEKSIISKWVKDLEYDLSKLPLRCFIVTISFCLIFYFLTLFNSDKSFYETTEIWVIIFVVLFAFCYLSENNRQEKQIKYLKEFIEYPKILILEKQNQPIITSPKEVAFIKNSLTYDDNKISFYIVDNSGNHHVFNLNKST